MSSHFVFFHRLLVVLALLLATSVTVHAEEPAEEPTGPPHVQRGKQVQRGEYLVHHVAMCVQCHSPRSRRGELIESKLLHGGRVPTGPLFRDQPWATHAPRLAGLPAYDTKQVVELLTQGSRPGTKPPRAPMPPFRLDRDDAEAIVAYLKSLAP